MLRKEKQREEGLTKNIQDTPSSVRVNLSFGEGCPNGIQMDPVGQVHDDSCNEKAVEIQ